MSLDTRHRRLCDHLPGIRVVCAYGRVALVGDPDPAGERVARASLEVHAPGELDAPQDGERAVGEDDLDLGAEPGRAQPARGDGDHETVAAFLQAGARNSAVGPPTS